ncbi:peptidase S8 [Chloroflexus islandicus]|uniref:Peptidase S8 n=1 Tax=Chloroflexus islandicus TaxID=1707952 RepID=A0A178MJD8_9CHLR|nr:S8 family serine peptidase [Chloroflexus islandicus]OAN48228.1 peptidase S8 [Chloroflexus islandicus]
MKRRLLLILLIIASLASLLALAPAVPVRADPATLSATPTSLAATVELGSTVTLNLTITNTGSNPITPMIYAGLPPAAAPAARMAPPSLPVPLPQQAERIDPDLQAELASGPTQFLVFFADRPDLGEALLIRDWEARGEYVYRTLVEHAERSQHAVRAMLDAAGVRYKPLWIVNALLVEGNAALANALATHADVAMLTADHELQMSEPVTTATVSCNATANNVCWNIAKVNADRVWREFGVTGAGITVANIDSGVVYTHTALINQYRGNLGGGSFDHNYNWFDPVGNNPEPVDSGIHGTHVMGTMVATPPGQPAMGMAPGAKWIAARACDSSNCSNSNIIAAAQWMLAPTDSSGNNPRPSMRPHILNNSWAFESGGNPIYAGYTAAWQAAGIFSVFAAGNIIGSNNYTGCGSIASPGDYPDVTAVGATDQNDLITSFSRIGPTTDNRIKPDLVAPGSGIISTKYSNDYQSLSGTSMAAPHVAGAVALLWSANPQLIGDYAATYAILTGNTLPITSDSRYMGAAHTACRPTTVPNNIYGYGRLDAFAAVAAARVQVPWLVLPAAAPASLASSGTQTIAITLDARKVAGPGIYTARVLIYANNLTDPPLAIPVTMTVPARPTHATITGTVTDSETGQPLSSTVTVADGVTLTTNAATGAYTLVVPGGVAQTLSAAANNFAPQSQSITPAPGSTVTLNFALDPLRPRLTVLQDPVPATVDFNQTVNVALPLRNDGNIPLSYTLRIDNEPYGVWRSDEPDGPTGGWINPPPSRDVLNLYDDESSGALDLGFDFPFGNNYYRHIYVGANGIIAFAPFVSATNYFSPSCMPLNETGAPALTPLHVDFNSSAGGEISFAHTSAGALITWDDVPLYGASRRLSVQALLQPNGQIRFHYRDVSNLLDADAGVIGLQLDGAVQTIGCSSGSHPPLNLSNGLVIELRPQINPQAWLSAASSGSTTVAVGATSNAQLTARWIGPIYQTQQARLRIISNDPRKPVATARVQLNEGVPAPYQVIIVMVYR